MKEFKSMTTKICGWCSDGKEPHKTICNEEKELDVKIIQFSREDILNISNHRNFMGVRIIKCTREKGHSGKHILCGLDYHCIHAWETRQQTSYGINDLPYDEQKAIATFYKETYEGKIIDPALMKKIKKENIRKYIIEPMEKIYKI